ncbi:2-oxo-tetronate isomerase [Hoeflea poritis]|uniref:Hydroxypyruvate isomerase family protein n=1 Tax=Hoeflea poritis TaxID=2993659 RepID=A0ABT4VIR7_9HYPH|nr:2-oxo-tetronate isomerase [Hoeflea poritis]MDA4844494.1 hydroxypyruvate isomerase family protein [Hoeflea poritis]
MPRFSANISMMFHEHPFLERFGAARDAGFEAVEFLFPYEWPVDSLARAVGDSGHSISIFNLSPGDWERGERGLACIPGREAEFREFVETAIAYAEATGARRLHALAGIPGALPFATARATYLENLRFAAERLGEAGLEMTIEPINGRDMPGYFLSSTELAAEILRELGLANVGLQFDVYHHQIMHGDILHSLERYMPLIRHIQIAGVPERHEPDSGELDYVSVFKEIDALGYDGWVGCEYRPKAGTVEGLGWMRALTGV